MGKTYFYDQVFKCYDSLREDGFLKEGEHQPLKVEIKSKEQGTKLHHILQVDKEIDGKTSTYGVKNEANVRHSLSNETRVEVGLASGTFTGEVSFSPKDLNTSERSVKFSHLSELDTGKNEWNSTETAKFGITNLGPLAYWGTASLKWNLKKEYLLTVTDNFRYQDVHFGLLLEHDLKDTKKFQKIEARTAWWNKDLGVFGSYSHLEHLAFLGLTFQASKCIKHFLQVQWKKNDETSIKKSDISLSLGNKIKFNDSLTCKGNLRVGSTWWLDYVMSHKLNKNLTLNYVERFNLCQALGCCSKDAAPGTPYTFGVGINWKI